MKILAVECSAGPASCCIIENGKIIANSFVNTKLTHSQTLMPMIKAMLDTSTVNIDDIDCYAISSGPGSFTGVRIGISAVKGLASPKNKPCIGVSTLMAIAENYLDRDCYVCAVMDARCNQVYNGIFEIKDGCIARITEDSALLCDELAKIIKKMSRNDEKCVIIVGDGSDVFFPYVKELENIRLADETRKYQNAIGVALLSEYEYKAGNAVTADELLPKYLRLPQAERELKKRTEG